MKLTYLKKKINVQTGFQLGRYTWIVLACYFGVMWLDIPKMLTCVIIYWLVRISQQLEENK